MAGKDRSKANSCRLSESSRTSAGTTGQKTSALATALIARFSIQTLRNTIICLAPACRCRWGSSGHSRNCSSELRMRMLIILDRILPLRPQWGGGLDYKLLKILAWRFQGDYIHSDLFDNHQNNLRLSTGIALHF